ncbi:MAG: response regulator [Mariprofundaceae bacterium]
MTKQRQVLIVEDEENIQGILTAFIERYFKERKTEVSIKSLDDPIRGLYDLSTRGEQYDLIILDVRLPKLGGDEIYNSIAHVTPKLVDRIMFVTGYPDDLSDRWPDKTFTILEKPFRYDALSEKIDSVLSA